MNSSFEIMYSLSAFIEIEKKNMNTYHLLYVSTSSRINVDLFVLLFRKENICSEIICNLKVQICHHKSKSISTLS